jgi:hypothetical protein
VTGSQPVKIAEVTDRLPLRDLPPAPETAVKLTIAIPVREDSPDLADVVKNALAVDYGCPVEILVVQPPGRAAPSAAPAPAASGLRSAATRDNRSGPPGEARGPERSLGASGAPGPAQAEASADAMDSFADDPRVRVVAGPVAGAAQGDHLVELDAWQEYDPKDIPRLLEPVRAGHATVVFGRRMFGTYSGNRLWYVVGNKLLTMAGNVIFNCYLSDLETGYKLMPVDLYRSLGVTGDAAVTGRLLRRGIRPYEVPVSYRGRPAGQGSGIRWWNRAGALLILLRERVRPV